MTRLRQITAALFGAYLVSCGYVLYTSVDKPDHFVSSLYNFHPKLTHDAKSVLFLVLHTAKESSELVYSLWRVDTDGKNLRRIADSSLFTNPSNWKPPPG